MTDGRPRKVIVKLMSVNAGVDKVYAFFEDVKKSMEAGQAATSVKKGANGWWTFDHVSAGKAKLRQVAFREAGVLDHIFSGGGVGVDCLRQKRSKLRRLNYHMDLCQAGRAR